MPVQIDPNVVKVKRVNAEQLKYIHDKLVGKVNAHNTDGLSHADIRQDIGTKIGEHNVNSLAHNDIRELIKGLTARLNGVLDSNDVNLDQLSEIVAYIKSNKTLIEQVTTNKVNVTDVVNNLTTNATDKPLSASMGVELKKLIDAISKQAPDVSGQIDTHDKSATSHADIRQDVTTLKENLNGLDSRKADAIVNTVCGENIILTDSDNEKIVDFKIFGKSTQSGIPTPTAPISIVSVGDKGNVNLTIDGQPQQLLTLATPTGLRGVKVVKDGNYTDATGQQWLSDRVIKKDGVIGIERNAKTIMLNGSMGENIVKNGEDVDNISFFWNKIENGIQQSDSEMLCDKYEVTYWNEFGVTAEGKMWYARSSFGIKIAKSKLETPDVNGFRKYMQRNPIKVLGISDKSTFEPLPQAEQDAIRKLHTNYPTTAVTNDEKAHMEVTYTADTKNFILGEIAKYHAQAQAQQVAMMSLLPDSTQATMIENDTNNILNGQGV